VLKFPRFSEQYQPKNDDGRALIEQFVARTRAIGGKWTDKIKRGVPNARFVDVI
jgi:hypothetical protein